MLIYLLKSAACMALFLLFYKLLLEKENMHVFKRFYLMLALVASLVIPGLVFIAYVEPVVTTYSSTNTFIDTSTPIVTESPARDIDVINWSLLAWSIYSIGVAVYGIRFLRNLFQILNRIRKNPKLKQRFSIKVLLLEQLPPHTFFKYIFLNKVKFEANTIPEEVVLHEEIHAKQRHSIDVIFVELLQVILWFNPLIFFFKKCIKLNHEFLADSAVIKKTISTSSYQNTLLSYLSQDSLDKYQSVKMANAINYSSIKKRFKVMKTQTSKKAMLLRSLLLFPLLAMMLYGFSETKTIERANPEIKEHIKEELEKVNQLPLNIVDVDGATKREVLEFNILAEKYNAIPIEKRLISLEDLKILEFIYRKMSDEQKENAQPFPECLPKNIQKGASREQMKEYNALAKKYNEMSRDNMRIYARDVERLEYIYSLMSDKQKADAEPFPDFPEPPPAPAPEAPKHTNVPNPSEASRVLKGEVSNIPPPPPSPKVIRGEASAIPAPPFPPEPIEPLDHVIDMAKKGATFYYEGKKISSDKAIELLKKNESLNISTTKSSSKNPQVRISKEPITIKRTSSGINLETGNIKVNGKELFFSTKNGITNYFNKEGQQVDRQGRLLSKEQKKNPTFYFNGEEITSTKANQLLKNNKSIQIATEDYTEDEYAIVLTDLSKATYQNHNKNNNPNSVIDLTEMIEKEASFFYNDEPISVEKAIWLTKNETIERVNNIGSKTGKPKVYLWKKV